MKDYKKLITSFLNNGYKTNFFSESINDKNILILRHDIDFDIEYAYKISLMEDELNVKSTYFFLMHSKSYNLLEQNNLELIKSIQKRGHKISIHFDPTIYKDIESGFLKEKKLFENIFDLKIEHTSIHRPSDYFLNNPNAICGINHTYQPKYFNKIKYFADSHGEFRYGNPLDSQEFQHKDSIQLLTHPIWWVTRENEPFNKLEEFLNYRIAIFKEHMAFNCTPYKNYIEKQK